MRNQKPQFNITYLFSFPLADKAFDFHSTSISEIQKFAKEKWDIEISEFFVCTCFHLITIKDPSRHQCETSSTLEIYKDGDKYIALLVDTSSQKES